MIRHDTAGSTLGLRAPDCAKESSTLWTLFTLRRDYVCADARPYLLKYTSSSAGALPAVTFC